MKIRDILRARRSLSFEFYPPKTAEGVPPLFRAIDRLNVFKPDFVSVTYGAGGTTRNLTEDIVVKIKTDANVLPMAHVTCVGQTRDEIYEVLSRLAAADIENVIALRGDPPRGESAFVPIQGGFAHSTDLIEYVGRHFNFGMAAACYPEGHTESPDLHSDLSYTKQKLQAGADFLITQLFYDNRYFFNFLEMSRKVGIDVPILAGILPILSTTQIRRFTALCGATIPLALDRQLEKFVDDDDAVRELGIEYATTQVKELWDNGVDGVHFYALNRSHSISKILENLDFLNASRAA